MLNCQQLWHSNIKNRIKLPAFLSVQHEVAIHGQFSILHDCVHFKFDIQHCKT